MTWSWIYAIRKADVLRLLATWPHHHTHVRHISHAFLDAKPARGRKRVMDDVPYWCPNVSHVFYKVSKKDLGCNVPHERLRPSTWWYQGTLSMYAVPKVLTPFGHSAALAVTCGVGTLSRSYSIDRPRLPFAAENLSVSNTQTRAPHAKPWNGWHSHRAWADLTLTLTTCVSGKSRTDHWSKIPA